MAVAGLLAGVLAAATMQIKAISIALGVVAIGLLVGARFCAAGRDRYSLSALNRLEEQMAFHEADSLDTSSAAEIVCPNCFEAYDAARPACPRCGKLT